VIRVVVVDDEALVRSGFEMILNAADDIQVVATAVGSEAVSAVRRESPDVVLLDIRMPDVDGLTVLAELQTLPAPPVVAMLTTFDTDEYFMTALHSGAAGFLLKDTEPDQLAQLVRTLAAGGVVLSPRAPVPSCGAGPPVRRRTDAEEATRVSRLTDRERAVLTLVAEGLSNADIGARIHLSAGTVKDHVSAILTKLRVASRVQAALIAQRTGLLDPKNKAGDEYCRAGPCPPGYGTPGSPLWRPSTSGSTMRPSRPSPRP